MPRVSQIQIEAKRMGYFISNLWNVVTLIESKEEAIQLFKELLTPTEVRMLAKRIQIAKMLLEGHKYDTIKSHARVTDSTISSVNNQLNFGGGGYNKIVNRLITLEVKKQERLEGKKSILDPGPYAGRKTSEWLLSKAAKKIHNYSKKKSVEDSIT